MNTKFFKRTPPHGFSAVIDFSVPDILIHSWNDDFSTTIITHEEITVFVQAGVRSQESSKKLLDIYINKKDQFIPPRDTEGSFLIVDKRRRQIIA